MKRRLITAGLMAGLAITARADSGAASQARRSAGAVESRIAVAGASLYSRAIGRGQPVIVLHGGPDVAFSGRKQTKEELRFFGLPGSLALRGRCANHRRKLARISSLQRRQRENAAEWRSPN